MLDIHVTPFPQMTLVALSGVVDDQTSRRLEQVLLSLIDGGARRLVIDLTAAPQVTSAGLRVVFAAYRKLGPHGGIILCCPAPGVQQLLRLSGLARLLVVYGDPISAQVGLARYREQLESAA